MMYSIRIHGRGGQGGRIAAKILGLAAFFEEKKSQAFALYGAERRGAPVTAFCRIDDKEILERGYIHKPDCVIILDDTLLMEADELKLFDGAESGTVLINTCHSKIKIPFFQRTNIVCVDATKIALDIIGKPIYNTTMLGAFAKKTKILKLDSIREATAKIIGKKKKHLVDANLKAIQKCYEETK